MAQQVWSKSLIYSMSSNIRARTAEAANDTTTTTIVRTSKILHIHCIHHTHLILLLLRLPRRVAVTVERATYLCHGV